MTFDEAINRYRPLHKDMAILEPWVSGGTTKGGLVVSHSHDLPCVYGFIWRLHREYVGPLVEGDMVVYPRYAYQTFAEGSGLGEDGEPQKWSLAIINIDDIEAIIPLEELTDPFSAVVYSNGELQRPSAQSGIIIR